MNDRQSARVVFDLETVAIDDAPDYLEPVTAPDNYRDPEKIAAYVAEHTASQLERCSLDPDLCRIVALGWWREDEPAPTALTLDQVGEAEMLARFWGASQGRHCVGFNCIGFDAPVLLRRSLYLGVPAPALQVDRFRHPTITDLLQVLSHHGAFKFRSLDFYARRLGCPVRDDLTGTDIAAAVREGRWADVERHVMADIQKTAFVAGRLGYFNGAAFVAA